MAANTQVASREKKSISLEANDATDNDANGDSGDIPAVLVLELKAVVVGKERYLFGKGIKVLEEPAPVLEKQALEDSGTNSILSAVQN